MVSFAFVTSWAAAAVLVLGSTGGGAQAEDSLSLPAFYEPDHPYLLPTATDQRSPSALINTLANHGYIDRSGVQVDLLDLATQMEAIFNLHPEFAFLSHVVPAIECGITAEDDAGNMFVDLADMFGCGGFDSFLVRSVNDPTIVDPFLLQDLLMPTSPGSNITLDAVTGEELLTIQDLMNFQFDRIVQTAMANPNVTIASDYLSQNLLLLTLVGTDPTLQTLEVNRLFTLLMEERFPDGFLPGTLREDLPFHFTDPADPVLPLVDQILMNVEAALSVAFGNGTDMPFPPAFDDEVPPPGFFDPGFDDGPPPGFFDGPPPGFFDDGPPPGFVDVGPPPGFFDDDIPPGLFDDDFPPGFFDDDFPSTEFPLPAPIDGNSTDSPTFAAPEGDPIDSNSTSAPSTFESMSPTLAPSFTPGSETGLNTTTAPTTGTTSPSASPAPIPSTEMPSGTFVPTHSSSNGEEDTLEPTMDDTTMPMSMDDEPTIEPTSVESTLAPSRMRYSTIAPSFVSDDMGETTAPSSATIDLSVVPYADEPTDEPTIVLDTNESTDEPTIFPDLAEATDEPTIVPDTDEPTRFEEFKEVDIARASINAAPRAFKTMEAPTSETANTKVAYEDTVDPDAIDDDGAIYSDNQFHWDITRAPTDKRRSWPIPPPSQYPTHPPVPPTPPTPHRPPTRYFPHHDWTLSPNFNSRMRRPRETPVEKPTEMPVAKPTKDEDKTDRPTKMPVERPNAKPIEIPEETPVEKPSDMPVEKPTDENDKKKKKKKKKKDEKKIL